MKNLAKLLHLIFTLIVFLTLFSTISCKYDLIPEPSGSTSGIKKPSDYEDKISPPQNVQASHGDSRKVTITWDPLPNAVNYLIYSAPTPFDDFQQIGEQKETSFISDREDFGINKYYAVKAVNYYGTESFLSDKVMGSTLGKPFITSIDPADSGNSVTVHWWMDNCTKSTYQDLVQFKLYAYLDANMTSIPGFEPLIIPSTDDAGNLVTSATISNLTPKTDYYFIVEVSNIEDPQILETSDLTSQSTAHQLIPSPAISFSAEQGINKDQVILTWKLPDSVDFYDTKSLIYEEHPVYFTLSRKLLNEEDSKYKTIAKYIGVDTLKSASQDCYTFDCSTNTTNASDILTVEKDAEYDDFTNPLYSAYTPNSKITFIDKDALRNNQYSYKLQTFTDFSGTKVYEAETIVADGWKLAAPEMHITSLAEKDEEDVNQIKNIKVDYELNFNAFGKDYTYVLVGIQTPMDPNDPNVTLPAKDPYVIATFTSVDEINSYVTNFNPSTIEKHGYYTFQFYILNHTDEEITEVPADYLDMVDVVGTVTVTNDAKLIPVIKNFTIKDGYKDKYVISWNASEIGDNCKYTLNWISYNGTETTKGSDEIDDSVIKAGTTGEGENKVITINHTKDVFSGEVREYSLTANTGLSVTENYETKSYTLGTAEPVMAEIDYDSITVSWKPVQMATEDYVVSAIYDGDTEELAINDEKISSSTTIELVDGVYKYIINKPKGYDDATISGKNINFKVTAKSSKTEDSTTCENINVRTLGPALLNVQRGEKDPKKITINWNSDKDAKGYIIHRILYKTPAAATADISSTYYYNCETGAILDKGGDSVEGRVQISNANNTVTLVDYQKAIDEGVTGGYQEAQDKIQWGLPFGYVVLPVNDTRFFEDSKFDAHFVFDLESQTVDPNSSEVNYKKLDTLEVKNATHGFGLNVQATKAEDASKITLNWQHPYFDGTPSIFRREYILNENDVPVSTDSEWKIVQANLPKGTENFTITCENSDWGKAYEYAVQYATSESSYSVKSFEKYTASYQNRETRYTYPDTQVFEPSIGEHGDYVQIWEPANKGYLLALEDFKAGYGGVGTTDKDPEYFQENITWKNWDYRLRVLGPDSFTFGIKNKNLSLTKDWVDLVCNTDTSINNYIYLNSRSDTSVIKEDDNNLITVKPIWNKDDKQVTIYSKTDGYLKVLRDAKHYYSISLTRNDSKKFIPKAEGDSTSTTTRQASDESIYAYRQITDEEFTKAVMLTIADAFNGTNNTKSEVVLDDWMYGKRYAHTTDSAFDSGSFKFIENKNNISLNATNYIHLFTSTPVDEDIISCFKITASITEGGRWNNNTSTYNFRYIASEQKDPSASNMVCYNIINSFSDINLSSYVGKVYFSASDSNLYLKATRTINKIETTVIDKTYGLSKDNSSNDDLRYWNPMHIAANDYIGTNSTYGWWN